MSGNTWTLIKATVNGYIDGHALSRGAAIAYHTAFSARPNGRTGGSAHRRGQQLRRGRRARDRAAVGLLLLADLPAAAEFTRAYSELHGSCAGATVELPPIPAPR